MTLKIIRDVSGKPEGQDYFDYEMPKYKSVNDKFLLNSQPILLRDLKIAAPPKRADNYYYAAENLILRSGPTTGSKSIKTMERGTLVMVMEIGKSETINGITSNWVKVEIYERTGWEVIPTDEIGWCFGGYLVE